MPANAGGLPDDDEHAARELHALLGDGDAGLGRERLDAWLALGVLPVVPSYVRTTHALWRAASGWTRLAGEVTPALLLGHFRGEWALGGVFAGESPLVVHDIDNQAGKSGTGGVDADLAARVEAVRRAAPGAVWLRSSGTGGLHAWTFLDESHPLRVLVYLARERVLRAADAVAEVAARLAGSSVGGVPGFLELLPQLGEQGGVIRAPLGPGSALLDGDLRPLDLSPGEAVARLVELARARRQSLLEAFPREPRSARSPPAAVAPVAPPGIAASQGAPPATHAHARLSSDWRTLLRLCDGRLPRELRAPRATYESVARRLWDHGLPGASTRHAATFLLALSCRWQRLARDEAEARVVAWFRDRGWVRSREWRVGQRSRRAASCATRTASERRVRGRTERATSGRERSR